MEAHEIDSFLKFHKEILAIVADAVQTAIKNQQRETFQSEAIDKLAAALSVAQGEYLPLVFNMTNPYERWEYNDMESIISAVRDALSKNEISFTQQPIIDETGATILYTQITHSSGQWMRCKSRIVPTSNNQHEYDSILMAQKKNAASSLLGIAAKNDRTDDDSEYSMNILRTKEDKGLDPVYVHSNNNNNSSYERITKEQLEEIEYTINDSGMTDLVKQLLSRERIETLADLPKSRYYDTLKRTNEIIALRKGLKK